MEFLSDCKWLEETFRVFHPYHKFCEHAEHGSLWGFCGHPTPWYIVGGIVVAGVLLAALNHH